MANANELLQKARTYLEQGEYTNAEQAYRDVLNTKPDSAEALAELGRFAMMREEVDTGLELVEKALSIQPRFAQALAYKGLGYTIREDFEKSIPLYEEAVKLDPTLTMAWFNMARSYRKLGLWEKAETAVREALRIQPDHFQAHYELSTILANTQRVPDAIREALESIRINPLFLKGYLTLGKAYELGGKGDLAIALYREGLKKIPNALILREELVRLYMLKRNIKAAYLEQALITQHRNIYDNNMRLGNLAILAGDFEGAEKAFKRAIQQNPNSGEPHFNLGEIYQSANLSEEALKEYMEVIRLDDTSWKPFNSIGVLYMKDDKPDSLKKSVEYFQEAINRNPQTPEPYFNLALIYGNKGNKADAEKYARLALARTPQDGILKQDIERLLQTLDKM